MAGTWIESHQALRDHPKVKRLARLLGVGRRDAIGLLHLLWWWAVDYAPDGALARYGHEDLAEAVLWDGSADGLVAALVDAGWLEAVPDAGLLIHDWDEYAGRLIAQRRASAERKRAWRQSRDGDATGTPRDDDPGRVRGGGVQDRTGRTGPDRTNRTARRGAMAPPAPEQVHALVTEFGGELGEARVRECIAEALNHTSARKALDVGLYLRRWLRREVEWQAERRGAPHRGSSALRVVPAAVAAWGAELDGGR